MTEAKALIAPPGNVLAAFGLSEPQWERITSGHINLTWRLWPRANAPESLVLQRVNAIFPPAVQDDIAAVTRHLGVQGIRTIELIPTLEGRHYLDRDGEVWRLTRFIEGTTAEHVAHAGQAREAGRVLGEFHSGLRTFPGTLSRSRPNIHNLSMHLQRLESMLEAHREHRYFREIALHAARIVETAAEVRDHPPTPEILVHGDPKISNVVFDGEQAVCLIDLDTLNTMPAEIEIADALRSWCNAEPEDSPQAHCSAEYFEAACEGYAHIDAELAALLPDTTALIAVELAARFCADALAESYFGWDAERYGSASEHNQARCAGQLALAADILGQRAELRRIALAAATTTAR